MATKSERTRIRILQAANRLFYRHGYNRTSFSDIVEAAGVPRGNIYYYFPTKEAILLAALEHRLQILDTMMEEWNRNFPDPRGRLERCVQVMVNSREATAEHGCPMGTLNAELAKDQRPLQREALALFDRFIDYLSQQFLLSGHPPEKAGQLARELLARAQGINMLAHVYQDADFLLEQQNILDLWVEAMTPGEASDNNPR